MPELLRRVLVSRQWERERRERWGPDNPLYQSKVLAEFPDTSDDHVISPRLVAKARSLKELFGNVLRENEAMLKMCRELGFAVSAHPDEHDVVQATKRI